MEADIVADRDRGEPTSEMEPLVLGEGSRHRRQLTDLALELATASEGFRRSLPAGLVSPLADLVRSMNCYYSNLIEDHHTHPVDIERAMRNEYSADPVRRNLQREARAHVAVQQWVDGGALRSRVTTLEAIREIHQRFAELLPEELRIVTDPETGRSAKVVPGALRQDDVRVGRHLAISPGAIPRFLARFEHVYGGLGRSEAILAAAAAHHRLLWIHPFVDGNGRVARLMSHAMLLERLNTGAVWSVARGLARNVGVYKEHLMRCDEPRRHDVDGRGALSEEALAEFTRFFLDTCLEQVRFMEQLMQPSALRDRILSWIEEQARAKALPRMSGQLLEAALFRGELPRGDVATTLATSDRHARRVVAALVERGVLTSASPRAPLVLAFPAALSARWLPGLFPEQTTA